VTWKLLDMLDYYANKYFGVIKKWVSSKYSVMLGLPFFSFASLNQLPVNTIELLERTALHVSTLVLVEVSHVVTRLLACELGSL
jgi:hypothetical protein